jgi:hypothetical protein
MAVGDYSNRRRGARARDVQGKVPQGCSKRGTRSSPPGRSKEQSVQDKRRSGSDKPSYLFVPFNHRGGLFMPYGDLRPRACHEMAKRCCLTHRCQDVNAME